jgi:hypothetical protein
MLRDVLNLPDAVLPTTEHVAQSFFLDDSDTRTSVQEFDSAQLFATLVVTNASGTPGFAVDKHRDDAKKFALCRGMFEYLNAENGQAHMVTREQTERQKRNRAFAAEFLAPSSLLADRVSGATVDEEEVEDVADDFGVSALVIRHQLLNHNIVDEIVS